MKLITDREQKLESQFRKHKWFIFSMTILTGILLYSCLILSHQLFIKGHYWSIVPAGAIAHAFFIILIHDGAHKSITRTKVDRFLMNLGSAVMFLPFYGEPFRKYHLIHHGTTNSINDPLWPPFKKDLYTTKRWLYVLCECIPLLFTFYLVLKSDASKKVTTKKTGPPVNYLYMALATLLSVILAVLLSPSIWFILGTIFVLNLFSTLRHWCEHMGENSSLESNTFWFPLGMGIGNHDVHHDSPHLSWLTLMVGLFYRIKSTSPIKALNGVLFKKSFSHFEK